MRDGCISARPARLLLSVCCSGSCAYLVSSRGCLWERTQVQMLDGTQKELRFIQMGEQVASWDDEAQRVVGATVLGTEFATAQRMIELSFEYAVPESSAEVNSSSAGKFSQCMDGCQNASFSNGARSLLMTVDHPIFSARLQGLVSMDPVQTRIKYGISVEQMGHWETLHLYQSHYAVGAVRHLLGGGLVLMTLRLAKYHWFFANGVRVHNKARGGGMHSRKADGSGEDEPQIIVVYTNSSFSTSSGFASLILLHSGSRRRYGTYEQESDSSCTLHEEQDVKLACNATIVSDISNRESCCALCHNCLKCTREECVLAIPSCPDFLAQAYSMCKVAEADNRSMDGNFLLLVYIASGILVGCPALYCLVKYTRRWNKHRLMTAELESMCEYRQGLAACNAQALSRLELNGECTEKGSSIFVSYVWTLDDMGTFVGAGHYEEGISRVEGKLNWASSKLAGEVVWVEHWFTRDDMEFRGSISVSAKGITVTADYVYPFKRGSLILQEVAVTYSNESARPFSELEAADLGNVCTDTFQIQTQHMGEIDSQYGGLGVDARVIASLEEVETQTNIALQTSQDLASPYCGGAVVAAPLAPVCIGMIPEDEGPIIGVPLTPENLGSMLCAERGDSDNRLKL